MVTIEDVIAHYGRENEKPARQKVLRLSDEQFFEKLAEIPKRMCREPQGRIVFSYDLGFPFILVQYFAYL